jgi:hypothetical protein
MNNIFEEAFRQAGGGLLERPLKRRGGPEQGNQTDVLNLSTVV